MILPVHGGSVIWHCAISLPTVPSIRLRRLSGVYALTVAMLLIRWPGTLPTHV
jgi:hypothetical protein